MYDLASYTLTLSLSEPQDLCTERRASTFLKNKNTNENPCITVQNCTEDLVQPLLPVVCLLRVLSSGNSLTIQM